MIIAPWSDIFPQLRDAPYTRVDGKVYAVPEKFGYYGFCYNKDAVDPADAKRGDIAWNEKYKGRIGVYDYYFPVIQMVGLSMGIKPADITSDDLEAIRERLLAMKPNVKMIGDIVSVQNALVTGSVDVIVGGAEFAVSNLMPTNPQLDWVISDDGGLIWNQGIGILSDSNRQELAAEFIKWIMSPTGQGLLATSECFWAMPANEAAEISDCRQGQSALGRSGRLPRAVRRYRCCRMWRWMRLCSISGRSSCNRERRSPICWATSIKRYSTGPAPKGAGPASGGSTSRRSGFDDQPRQQCRRARLG